MSYQVIARKYRPQTFSDLTGQEHIVKTLENALDNSRLHHAYIFSGVRGTGKTTTARLLAKGMNCITGVTSKPCLTCDSCREIAAGNTIDVLEIDAASNTGVDNVRDVIINSIAIGPARDRYKIFVIDEVHMLSTNAFNALLKTLEEPPPHVFFVMATTALHKVPDTILSRCQQFEFKQISTEKIFQRLRLIAEKESIKINETALREIARAGAGSLRDAQSAFDQVIAFSGSEIGDDDVHQALGMVGTSLLERTTQAIGARDIKTLLDAVEELSSIGYDLRNFTRELMAWLRHMLVAKAGIENREVLGVADLEVPRLIELAAAFSEEDLVRCFHLLAEVEKEVKDSSCPRFSLEVGLIKLVHLVHLRPLDELVSRLEALETRVNLGSVAGGLSSGASGSGKSVAAASPPGAVGGARSTAKTTSPARSPVVPEPSKPNPRAATNPTSPVSQVPYSLPEEPQGLGDFEPVDESYLDATEYLASPAIGRARSSEVEAIFGEIERMNRNLLLTALEEAQDVKYTEGQLTVTFASESDFATRVRDSQTLFRELGDRLFKRSLKVDVRISGQLTGKVDQTKQAQEDLRQRAMKSPAVRMFIEKFQGEIVEIKEVPRKP